MRSNALSCISPTELNSPLPPSPPGFQPELDWNLFVPLNPTAVYVTAIKLMYGLCQQAWSDTVDLVHDDLRVVEQPGHNAIIYTSDNPHSTELKTGLAVRALYDVVFLMGNQEPGFYKVTSSIALQGRAIGRILITSKAQLPAANPTSSDRDFLNTTSTVDILGGHHTPNENSSSLAYSGYIPDPDDERFKISYQYVGDNVRSQEMFSAVLAGLASVAQYNDDGPLPWLSAVSFSGNLVFHFGARPRQALMGWHISRTFYLLVYHLFLVQRILKEMHFTLLYYGRPIADGFMKSMRSVGEAGAMGLAATT